MPIDGERGWRTGGPTGSSTSLPVSLLDSHFSSTGGAVSAVLPLRLKNLLDLEAVLGAGGSSRKREGPASADEVAISDRRATPEIVLVPTGSGKGLTLATLEPGHQPWKVQLARYVRWTKASSVPGLIFGFELSPRIVCMSTRAP